MILLTTLNEIRNCQPCKSGWETLLRSKPNIDRDEKFNILDILDSNGVDDFIWSLRVDKLAAITLAIAFTADAAADAAHAAADAAVRAAHAAAHAADAAAAVRAANAAAHAAYVVAHVADVDNYKKEIILTIFER